MKVSAITTQITLDQVKTKGKIKNFIDWRTFDKFE